VQQLTGRWINGPTFPTLTEEQWPVQTAMPSPAEHNMERRHVNAVSAASQVDIGNVIHPKVYQLVETDTRNGMAGEKKYTPEETNLEDAKDLSRLKN